MRAIYANIPWFNRIYIIINNETYNKIQNNQTFLNFIKINDLNNNITLIKHSEIFRNISNVLNNKHSNAIESNIHRIPGLSEYYIYLNDDYMIGKPLHYSFFFKIKKTKHKKRLSYLSFMRRIPSYIPSYTMYSVNSECIHT